MPPGSLIEYKNGPSAITVSEYWDIKFDDNSGHVIKLKHAADKVKFLVNDSVEKRLMSDVRLGAMLSGGLDSSAIVSSMRNGRNPDISTFTIGYEEEGTHNEGAYAKIIADEFQTNHHEKVIGLKDFLQDLENVIYYMDEPIADPSAMPIFDLCRFSKDYVTVLLSGVGGDELFAGYPIFKRYKSLLAKKWILSFPIVFPKPRHSFQRHIQRYP